MQMNEALMNAEMDEQFTHTLCHTQIHSLLPKTTINIINEDASPLLQPPHIINSLTTWSIWASLTLSQFQS